jgi:hypothetical protein
VRAEVIAEEERKRAYAEEKDRREIELAVPAPPSITEQEKLLVRSLETCVLAFVKSNPRLREARISIGGSTLQGEYATTFPSNTTLMTNRWWDEVCAWAIRTAPTVGRFRPRHTRLVRECFECVRDTWNDAHPDLPAHFGTVYDSLHIALP